MSFILDALKKSESERQQQGGAEFSSVPVSQPSSRPPAWLWVLGALLVVNLVVLAGVVLRPAAEAPQPAVSDDSFEQRIEIASREARTAVVEQPNAAEVADTDPVDPVSEPVTQAAVIQQTAAAPQPDVLEMPGTSQPARAGAFDSLPDIDQLRASGELPVGELRLDIHVYSDVPANRFVFINMVKHREGSSTSDGLTVDTITPDGVVLSYRGREFLLPRQ